MSYDYDLFVIGAGSGGVRAARMAAGLGKKVAVAEQSKPGGTCVNLGCVPKKLYVHAAEYASTSAAAAGFGWKLENAGFTWSTLRDNKSNVIAQANKRMEEMLQNSGAELIYGRASIRGPHQVAIADKVYSADRILIATGGAATRPDIPGSKHILVSDQIFDLDRLPQQMVVIGGGYIACEFAGIFHKLGVEVTQIYRGELFLRGFDVQIREFVADKMRQDGIDLRFETDVEEITRDQDGRYQLRLNDGRTLTTDLILGATGRKPNIADLGLDSIEVKTDERGAIAVDQFYQTSTPSIFALGDVIDRIQLTPVALAEAMTLVRNLYQGGSEPLDYDLIPTAVFSQPSIACVGPTEEEALKKFPQLDVYTTEFRPLKHALSGLKETILMKLLVDAQSQRVVAAHMAGEGAAETIQGIAIALKAGATKATFDQTIGIHPTSAEEFVTMRYLTRRHGVNS